MDFNIENVEHSENSDTLKRTCKVEALQMLPVYLHYVAIFNLLFRTHVLSQFIALT